MIALRLMTARDIRAGMHLIEPAGWNQTEADWHRAIALEPEGCFIAEEAGATAGTVTTCVFEEIGWVAMVIVSPSMRGRGIGKALMVQALRYLQDQNVRSVRLDATAMGKPLYEKLGFHQQYELIRHQGILPLSGPARGVVNARPGDLDWILRTDRAVTGTNRQKLLLALLSDQHEAVRVVRDGGTGEGFLMARRGARAVQIGPCIATGNAGPILFEDARHRYAGAAIYVDIPAANTAATRLAQAWGLAAQRPLVRMCLGPRICERMDGLWASSGPEKG
jgi:ribosomal protein S18 acetylase RimI-like enzyme